MYVLFFENFAQNCKTWFNVAAGVASRRPRMYLCVLMTFARFSSAAQCIVIYLISNIYFEFDQHLLFIFYLAKFVLFCT